MGAPDPCSRKRGRRRAQGRRDPAKRATESGEMKCPLHEKAHSPQVGVEVVRSILEDGHQDSTFFRRKQVEAVLLEAQDYLQETRE